MTLFLPWLSEEIRSGRISRVAPTTDLITYYIALLRHEFPPEVQRSVPPLEEIENCLIKTQFAARCAAIGQPTPATITPNDPRIAVDMAQDLGFPLILKPKSHMVVGFTERGRLIRDAGQLARYFIPYPVQPGHEPLAKQFPELRWPLLQRYIPSASRRVYSVTGLKDPDHGVVVASLSYKREQWPQDTGTSTIQVSCSNDAILRGGVSVVEQMISRGLFELELVQDGDSMLAIDLNPRAFGFIALDVALGRDLPWLWLRSTLGPIEPQPVSDDLIGKLEARHRFIHLVRWLIDWPTTLATGSNGVNSPTRRIISMVGHGDDPLPMLLGNLSLLRHPRSLFLTQLRAARHARREAREEAS
jgi:hypothetical protein